MRSGHTRLWHIARTLPLLALIAWTVTIWVPVLDSADNGLHTRESIRIVVTSLGGWPRNPAELEPEYVIIWSCLLTCVVSSWLLDGLRIWGWATTSLGVAVLWFLGNLIAEPPTAMWDGRDGNGRRIGGMEYASPDAGAAFWAVGGTALAVAGVCGLYAERRRCNGRSDDRARTSNIDRDNPRISRWFAGEPSRDGRIRVRRHLSAAKRLARVLPLLSVATWVVMIWVPIFADHSSDKGRVTSTSLGTVPIGIGDLSSHVVLPWVVVCVCAAGMWLMDSPLWWSIVVILLGMTLLIMLGEKLMDPPMARSPFTHASGEPGEVTIVGYPDAGVSYWALGSGALVIAGIAGIVGFIGDRRRVSFR